jgi:hypothetical protein
MCQCPRTQAARVAGAAFRSLVMMQATSTVFLPFLVTVRRTCATWAAPSNPVQAGASTALTVRRVRRPWSVLTAETAGTRAQGSFLSCLQRAGMLALTVIT